MENFDSLGDGIHLVIAASGDNPRRYRVKVAHDAPADFFEAEAAGLEALRASGTLRVPEVLGLGKGWIALEDLGRGRADTEDWARAGDALAALHAQAGECFGWDRDGYCGETPQPNPRCADGFRFFAEQRLLHQAELAVARELLTAADVKRVEALCERLPELLPPMPPVLIHGDLWQGNLHACSSGELALIDGGAVHHGWAEADLAMLTLFGEPPRAFFEAYAAASDGGNDWRERAPIYNLYHLLNHLNLFGESYQHSVRSVLDRFAS
jgi:protein-ribulosamine 3-kinase